MTQAEFRELIEAAITARRAHEHHEEASQQAQQAEVLRSDLVIATAALRDEAQRRLDLLLETHGCRKWGIHESEAL